MNRLSSVSRHLEVSTDGLPVVLQSTVPLPHRYSNLGLTRVPLVALVGVGHVFPSNLDLVGPKRGFGVPPGELFTISKPNPYPLNLRTPSAERVHKTESLKSHR